MEKDAQVNHAALLGRVEKQPKKVTIIDHVFMDDGRTVTFRGKGVQMVRSSYYKDGVLHARADLRNGKTVEVALPDKLIVDAALLGAGHKLCGGLAVTSLDKMHQALEKRAAKLASGQWVTYSDDTPRGAVSKLVKAVMSVRGVDLMTAKLACESLTHQQRSALRRHPDFADFFTKAKSQTAKMEMAASALDEVLSASE